MIFCAGYCDSWIRNVERLSKCVTEVESNIPNVWITISRMEKKKKILCEIL